MKNVPFCWSKICDNNCWRDNDRQREMAKAITVGDWQHRKKCDDNLYKGRPALRLWWIGVRQLRPIDQSFTHSLIQFLGERSCKSRMKLISQKRGVNGGDSIDDDRDGKDWRRTRKKWMFMLDNDKWVHKTLSKEHFFFGREAWTRDFDSLVNIDAYNISLDQTNWMN